jgi:CDP-4-dehydro-6-deoxyglucose reductase
VLELHFRPLPGNPDAIAFQQLLDHHQTLTIDGPHGEVWVEGPAPAPITVVAGGTGISQAHAIVEQLCQAEQRAPVTVVWSVVARSDAYCADFFRQAADAYAWLQFQLVTDTKEKNGALTWLEGRTTPIRGTVILAGSPGFVYSLADGIRAREPNVTMMADAFSYAPRQ